MAKSGTKHPRRTMPPPRLVFASAQVVESENDTDKEVGILQRLNLFRLDRVKSLFADRLIWAWFFAVLLSLSAFIVVWRILPVSSPFDPNRPHALYLLSAVSQGLAAILGIVVAIILLLTQLSSGYSGKVAEGLIDKTTLSYLALFIVSVLTAFMSTLYPVDLVVKTSLSLTVACLALLLPYLVFFTRRLNPTAMLDQLSAEALSKTAEKSVSDAVLAIYDVVMASGARRDYDTFRHGIFALFDLCFQEDNLSLGREAASRMADICARYIDDPVAVAIIAQRFQYLGLDAIGRLKLQTPGEEKSLFTDIKVQLRRLSVIAIDQQLAEPLEKLVACFIHVGTEASRQGLEKHAQSILWELRTLGIRAAEVGANDAFLLVTHAVELLGSAAMRPQSNSAISKLRDSVFIRLYPMDSKERAPGREGTRQIAIDLLKEAGNVARTEGWNGLVEIVKASLVEIAKVARENHLEAVADEALRTAKEL